MGAEKQAGKAEKMRQNERQIETLVEMGAQSGTESFQSCFYYVSAPSVIIVGTEGVTVTASWAVLVVPLHQDLWIHWHLWGFLCVPG